LEKVKEEKAAAESRRESEMAPEETSGVSESAELVQEKPAENQEEAVASETPVEEAAPASEPTESAENTTPVEKKEEA
jgi:hypothetical protein